MKVNEVHVMHWLSVTRVYPIVAADKHLFSSRYMGECATFYQNDSGDIVIVFSRS